MKRVTKKKQVWTEHEVYYLVATALAGRALIHCPCGVALVFSMDILELGHHVPHLMPLTPKKRPNPTQ